LEALQILHLEDLDKLQSLLNNEATLTFLKLKKLQLLNLKRMERWVAAEVREGGELTFPQLENLVIRGCPNLVTLPETPNLKAVDLDEGKAQLSLPIVTYRYMSLLSELKLHVRDKEAALELDSENNVESPLLELKLSGCDFLFLPIPSQPALGIWRWFGKLVSLNIDRCDALIYWPEDVFQSLVSLKDLTATSCDNLVGPAQVKVEAAPTTSQVLPHLNFLLVSFCGKLTELFVLPPSITAIHIGFCEKLKFTGGESKSVHVEQVNTSTSLEYHASTSVSMQPASRTNHSLPCLEYLQLDGCPSLVTLNLSPALKLLGICGCPELCFVSGQLDALKHLNTYGCNKLQSMDSLGHLPSLVSLRLERCKRLASLPGVLGSYSALRELTIKYCPAIDMKPLYK